MHPPQCVKIKLRKQNEPWRQVAHQGSKAVADASLLTHGRRALQGHHAGARDVIQNLEINGLKSEVAELRKLLNMVLVLVDPEDIQAALRNQELAPTNDEMRDFSMGMQRPTDLLGKD